MDIAFLRKVIAVAVAIMAVASMVMYAMGRMSALVFWILAALFAVCAYALPRVMPAQK